MSFLQHDLMVDATFELLNDTIKMQSEQIEMLEGKIASLSFSHQKELEKLKDQIKDSTERIKNLKATLKASDSKISSLIESKECLRLKVASNQKELHLKDQAISQQFQEISELKRKLQAEKASKSQLETACFELNTLLNKKSQELEESLEEVNESYKLIESFKSTSEANEAELVQNMLQLKQKVDQTCNAAISYEASNKELDTENKNLSNMVGELMEDVETMKGVKEQLEVKVYDLTVAKNDLDFAVHQKEQIIEVLINDSAKVSAAMEQLLTDSADKDDSFCKLYEQHMEESKEKESLITELKSTLVDSANEISDLRSAVKEILENCI